jgi:hypothetical protein
MSLATFYPGRCGESAPNKPVNRTRACRPRGAHVRAARAGYRRRSAAQAVRGAEVQDSKMKVATGRVVGGKVIVEGEPLTEGSVVTVVAREDDETFEVTPEEERALLEAIAQADRGQLISWDELREQLRRFG